VLRAVTRPSHTYTTINLVPRSRGGTDDEKNLVTLCAVCHGKLHGVN
jgi:5-methylcytosine-specific restriction endonuclease McrA